MKVLQPTCMSVALLACLVAGPARAAPVYLKCQFQAEQGPFVVDLTTDEQDSRVTVFLPHSGRTFRVNAVFSPDRVLFATDMVKYDLSRTNLVITRSVVMLKLVEQGRCDLLPTPKRAF